MAERLTRKTIVFARAFSMPGLDGPLPAGAYETETCEERIDGLSFVSWRRIWTTIEIRVHSASMAKRQLHRVDPVDLEAALEKDATGPR